MKSTLLCAASLAIALAVGTGPSRVEATPFTVIFTGTVISGFDRIGYFGATDTALDGKAFVVTVLGDTAIGGERFTNQSIDYLIWSQFQQPLTPNPYTAFISVGGVERGTNNNSGAGYQLRDQLGEGGAASLSYEASGSVGEAFQRVSQQLGIGAFSDFNDYIPEINILNPIEYDLLPTDRSDGGFIQTSYPSGTTPLVDDVRVNFFVTHVSVSSLISSVPEPATWGLLVVGFGAIGFRMRAKGELAKHKPVAEKPE